LTNTGGVIRCTIAGSASQPCGVDGFWAKIIDEGK